MDGSILSLVHHDSLYSKVFLQTLEEHLEPLAKIPGLNGRLSGIGSSFLMETYRIISIEQQTRNIPMSIKLIDRVRLRSDESIHSGMN